MGEENRKNMKKFGTVVLLTARPETIFERVRHDQNRPLLKDNMNVEYIASLMAQRQPAYQQAADLTVSTDGQDPGGDQSGSGQRCWRSGALNVA